MKQSRILVSVFLLFATITFAPTPEPTNALVGWCGAAGSPYIGSAATQPIDINVSNDTGTSSRSSIAINSSGHPCIAWMDSSAGNLEIFYARWNGTNWVNASGAILTSTNGNISNNTGGSTYPKLKLDSSDNPCISWTDSTPGNTEIYFARWNGSSWVTANGTVLDTTNANVSNDTNTSQASSLA
ncbi:MAG: hypothetical protein HGA95_02065, partial [Caldiserica bacterium]|nr:hypothetical protein [Caldisericota bacterium]